MDFSMVASARALARVLEGSVILKACQISKDYESSSSVDAIRVCVRLYRSVIYTRREKYKNDCLLR